MREVRGGQSSQWTRIKNGERCRQKRNDKKVESTFKRTNGTERYKDTLI